MAKASQPAWGDRVLSNPKILLMFLTVLNIVNYADRGVMNGVVPNLTCPCSCLNHSPGNVDTCCQEGYDVLQDDPPVCYEEGGGSGRAELLADCKCHDGSDPNCIINCADFGPITTGSSGLLVGAFMGGYVIASPIFAHLVHHMRPFRIIFIGMAIWTLSVITCALTPNYPVLFLARLVSGVGEASFQCIAPALIDDKAPKKDKGIWLSIFYAAIPVGYALGYQLSGFCAGSQHGWRIPFVVEAIALCPALIVALGVNMRIKTKSVDLASSDSTIHYHSMELDDQSTDFLPNLVALLKCRVWVMATLSYTTYTFVIGAIAFVGPTYVVEALGMHQAEGNLLFGLTILITGLVGTPFGGLAYDWLCKRSGTVKASIGFYWIAGVLTVGIIPSVIGLQARSPTGFFIGLFVAMFFFMAIQSPTNALLLLGVPARLRPLGMAMNVVFIHCLGDVISPSIVGWMFDYTKKHDYWEGNAIEVIFLWMVAAVIFSFLGACWAARHEAKFANSDEQQFRKGLLAQSEGEDTEAPQVRRPRARSMEIE